MCIDYQLVTLVKWIFDMGFRGVFLVIFSDMLKKMGIDYQLVTLVKWN